MLVNRKALFFFSALPLIMITCTCALTHVVNTGQGVGGYLAEYRFYRTLYTLMAGSALAIAGCFLQSTLRNPLIDHYILGVGSGALFALYLTVILYEYRPLIVALSAAMGGLFALALTVIVAERISGSDVAYVLSGIGITSLFSGLSALLSYYALTRYPYASLMLVGSFILATRDKLVYVAAAFILTYATHFVLSRRLNALLLGDEYAAQLGVNPKLTRLVASITSGTSASVLVSLFGLIGFTGIVAPHISRLLLRTSDNRVVVPMAATIGASILYVADAFSRAVTTPVMGEVPAGAIVSVFGAPFFLLLIVKRFKRGKL
ncbi:MAG: iron ABC transporter permease [Desulfurococcaceae archaeon]